METSHMINNNLKKLLLTLSILVFGSGCAATTPYKENMKLTEGPMPVSQITTPYDSLLSCLSSSYLGKKASIGVGAVSDETGKFSISDSGNGKYVTQAAGDIVQSALLQSKVVRVVNRRDPRVMKLEAAFGGKVKWINSDYHITGSINSLDFLPGGGIDASVYGVGAKYRQHRMLIGMDLFLTDTRTSEVVGNSSIFKQVVADEIGANIGRFFGDILVAVDLGEQHREAVHFALRNMLKMAVFEMMSDLYDIDSKTCSSIIEKVEGVKDANPKPIAASASVEPFDGEADWQKVSF
jgi:curli biogenesis system outer membrane secretion channel CsgG